MIDPDIVGRTIATTRFPIERSKLAELSRSYGDDDPVWHDHQAARNAGFREVPLHPTTTVLADNWRAGGATAMAQAVGADLRRVLHGEAAWEFLAPISVGSELTATQRVARIQTRDGRRGGTMTMVTFVTEFTDELGRLAVRRTDTLIETAS